MSYKDVRRALLDEDCSLKSTQGSHEKWVCPCGKHQAIVPRHRVISPGVVRDVIGKLDCLSKGWLQ